MAQAVEDLPSRRFGRYQLREKIGEGGMAEIFRADVVDGGELSTVALKVLKPHVPQQVRDLFFAEADLMGMLAHPNLVRRVEVGTFGGRMFLAMEDMYGGDLQKVCELLAASEPREHVPVAAALHVCLEVLRGLAYFHQAKSVSGSALGLVHGDLNPSNVLISAYGDVKLADFGVASIPGLGSGLAPGEVAGKLHYLSPEQVNAQPLTGASDIFSMGVMLHFLLFGETPFRGETEDEVLHRIAGARLRLPADADETMARILKKALAKNVKDRYHSAGAMAGDLLAYQLDHGLQFTRAGMQELLDRAMGIAV